MQNFVLFDIRSILVCTINVSSFQYFRFLNIPLKENVHQYDPTDQVKCLETHLKELVLKRYEASEQDVCFVKFFVLNAKVLKKIKFGVSEELGKEWMADHYRLLEMGARASPDAQLEFLCRADVNPFT
jgi:hypothetical protein